MPLPGRGATLIDREAKGAEPATNVGGSKPLRSTILETSRINVEGLCGTHAHKMHGLLRRTALWCRRQRFG